ncbi:PREDICTED: LOW QUALITY PROTEIN: beta-amylase 8 [Tarenaya hassleriana]|uniref:LOW QUALITY PROTEIN: beta-amylase 8 n=1 Tax=Tarenaya hassleriana TaxID=28532 RepID=UPI0008FD4B68|nr:PREDICTED: LOW QUALITY PROTEIN: beta-amylase 8 [Tarenaya hassleriana]
MHTLNNTTTDSQDPNFDPDQVSYRTQQQQPLSQPRRPRGFAAAAAARGAAGSDNGDSGSIRGGGGSGGGGAKGKREREKEKERTKLRERHRRAITSRMLAGLRQYGNFPLPARADMNDVIAALAREAGWTVETDGTTYRQSPPTNPVVHFQARSVESPLSSNTLKSCSVKAALDCQQSVLRIDENLSPVSLDSVVIAESDAGNERYTSASPINSVGGLEADQLIQDVRSAQHQNAFTGNCYVPVYTMLPAGIINNFCQLVDPEAVRQELSYMKSLNVDGVVIECWWGIVEGWNPKKYVWSGYRELFNIVRDFKLKLQVVMAFHEYGGNPSSNAIISLPQWVLEIAKDNPDIFFTDREGRRNTECLNWSIDKERVLHGRTGIEVYFDVMRSFRTEFDDLFAEGLISAVEIGLGASGELKYPSFSERMGWSYPGIGEFQCYDKYSQKNLQKAAKSREYSFWAKGPENAGHYNSRPHETGFFCDRGDYDSYYGRFFLNWYSQLLIEHAENVLSLASLAFDETKIIVKVPAIYWWYKTASHAAELTAGYYNPTNRDGYSPVFEALKKHSVTVKFVCSGLQMLTTEHDKALADPEGLSWQVLNAAWDGGMSIAGENAVSCFDREGCMRIVEMAKPRNHPENRHFSFFVYHQPSPLVQGSTCFADLDYFIKCMHGDIQR